MDHDQFERDSSSPVVGAAQAIDTMTTTTLSKDETTTSSMATTSSSSKTNIKVKQFISILEQLPRLCSPTICGTLSQPVTRNERVSLGADVFEWSLEQKAILSPANITTDMEAPCDWQTLAEVNPSWRQQESETFFSQKTIAPSPMITAGNHTRTKFNQSKLLSYDFDEDDEDEEEDDDSCVKRVQIDKPGFDIEDDEDDNDHDDDDNQDEDDKDDCPSNNFDYNDEPMDDDDLFFSPQPLKSSQTQQKMDIFSPGTFVRVMEDENTLQSTPKTIGPSIQRARNRQRVDMLD